MEVSLAAIADCANVSDLGKMNIMGVFSSIFASTTPVPLMQCHLAIIFKPDESEKGQEFQVKVDIRNPDGKPIIDSLEGKLSAPAAPAGERQEVNLIIGLNA